MENLLKLLNFTMHNMKSKENLELQDKDRLTGIGIWLDLTLLMNYLSFGMC